MSQRTALLTSWLALGILILVWHQAEPTPAPVAPWLLGLFSVLPLLLCTPALLRPSRNKLVSLALICLLYFAHAVTSLMGLTGSPWWPAAELALVLLVFVCALLCARQLPMAQA